LGSTSEATTARRGRKNHGAGYLGIEPKVVDAIAAWITSH